MSAIVPSADFIGNRSTQTSTGTMVNPTPMPKNPVRNPMPTPDERSLTRSSVRRGGFLDFFHPVGKAEVESDGAFVRQCVIGPYTLREFRKPTATANQQARTGRPHEWH